ncbi:MAG TPA: tyrosine-type recombinase/integrase [Myxococcota bacterium]|nr:tyrosine-type recombinase/integrase [Myxococcota bacterium]
METVLDKYEQCLERRGNKSSSIERTMRRLRLFHDPEMPVAGVTTTRLKRRYAERQEQVAVDTHRNELNESKTFWRWCVRERYVGSSPAEDIEPQGRRKRGKFQLRRSEARALFAEAHRLAESEGDERALAVLSILCMGLRSGELLDRRARDVDVGPEGVLLWIDEGKTPSARRYHEVPDPVAGLLAARVAGLDPKSWLFPADTASGHRRLEWMVSATKRLCLASKVPVVTPHGLRGTWATLSSEAGVASHVVARELGHSSPLVTKRHYIAPGSDDRTRTRKMLRVVSGGTRYDARERE